MSLHRRMHWVALGCGLSATLAWGSGLPAPLEAESLSTGSIDPAITQRVYVSDIARAFYAAAVTDKEQEVFNVGTGNPQTVNRLIELLKGNTIKLPC